MEVILQKDFVQLGYVGDVVDVARGYARNYLIPNGICLELSSRRAKHLKHQVEAINARKAKAKVEAEKRAKEITGMILEFKLVVGSSGKSFGSISSKDIEKALLEKGLEFNKKQIRFETVKSSGEFPVKLKLHSDVEAEITARVFAENKKGKAVVEEIAEDNTAEEFEEFED